MAKLPMTKVEMRTHLIDDVAWSHLGIHSGCLPDAIRKLDMLINDVTLNKEARQAIIFHQGVLQGMMRDLQNMVTDGHLYDEGD